MSQASGKIFYILYNKIILSHFKGPKRKPSSYFHRVFLGKKRKYKTITCKIINCAFTSDTGIPLPSTFLSSSGLSNLVS